MKIKLAIVVEGEPKASYSLGTIPRCSEGCSSIPWIGPLYHWSLPYNAECETGRHRVPFFETLVWLDLGLNGFPDHWWILSLSLSIYIYIYIYIYVCVCVCVCVCMFVRVCAYIYIYIHPMYIYTYIYIYIYIYMEKLYNR